MALALVLWPIYGSNYRIRKVDQQTSLDTKHCELIEKTTKSAADHFAPRNCRNLHLLSEL